jgi:hypothetical protein
MTALTTFRRIAREFAAIADGEVEEWLADAASSMAPPARWGAVYDQAVANLAAHLMTRGGAGQVLTPGDPTVAAAGGATSITTGRLAVSFGSSGGAGAGRASDGSEDDYTTTKYGLRYLALMKTRAARLPRVL